MTGFSETIQRIISLAYGEGRKTYLVGGSVRDILMGMPLKDIDLAVMGDTFAFARSLARSLCGTAFPLDRERGMMRVARGQTTLHIDISPVLGGCIDADLKARDFTINAIAIPLHIMPVNFLASGRLQNAPLEDPLEGLLDIAARRVRMVSEGNLRDDPVRILRGARMAASLGFNIDPSTEEAIRRLAPLLTSSAPERIRDEFFLILDEPGSAGHLRRLDRLGLLTHIIPEIEALRSSVRDLEHALSRVDALEKVPALEPICAVSEVEQHLRQTITPPRTRKGLLAFIGFVWMNTCDVTYREKDVPHSPDDRMEDIARERAQALKLSARETDHIAKAIIALRQPPLSKPEYSLKVAYRFCRLMGNTSVEAVLLDAAEKMASREGLSEERVAYAAWMLKLFFDRRSLLRQPKLANGHELQDSFDMKPGKDIGRVLESLREAQVEGIVKNREEALLWLARHIKQGRFHEKES